jgi:hypothetical protein
VKLNKPLTSIATSVLIATAALASSASGAAHCHGHTVSYDLKGKTHRSVSMHVCDRLTVKLHYPPMGFYHWDVTHKPKSKTLKLKSSGINGPKGIDFWVYRAHGKGQTSVTFGYFLSSNPGAHPMQTFKVSVKIT